MLYRNIRNAFTAIALGLGAATAHAAIVTTVGGVTVTNQGQTSAFATTAGYTTVDFNLIALGSLPAGYSGNGRVVQGSLSGEYAVPQRPANQNNSRYLAVPTQLQTGPFTLTINAPSLSSYFGLWWGSVDNYNSISFFRNDVQVGSTITGEFLRGLPAPLLTAGTQTEAAYFNFAFTNGDAYDRIVLTSTNFALESDNHVFGAAVVPVPGAALLMLSGLLGMVFATRRERKVQQVA